MLSLARLALRAERAQAPTMALTARCYTDAAGPSRLRDQQRREMRERVASGRTRVINDLSFLDSPRQSNSREGSGSRYPGKRFEGGRAERDDYYLTKRALERTGKGPAPTPLQSSTKVKNWIDRHEATGKPVSDKQVDELVRMVEELQPRSVNAAVWNRVLAFIGREKKYARMWKAFNQMKKRNVAPSSRTFTTLLNAYAGISHSSIPAGQFTPLSTPERKTLERVGAIYEQSQKHIAACVRKSRPAAPEAADSDIGLAATGSKATADQVKSKTKAKAKAEEEDDDDMANINTRDVNVAPTNSYLKFLGRFGMWDEMNRVFVAMDQDGPLSPDAITYTTMLLAAGNIAQYHKANPEGAQELPKVDLGPVARGLWDRAVRHMTGTGGEYDATRRIDESLTLIALECLANGRPEDQRLVEKLIPCLWDLPTGSTPQVASVNPHLRLDPGVLASRTLPAAYQTLPRFKLGVRAATKLMTTLTRSGNQSLAAHYTNIILDMPDLQSEFDFPALRAAVHALAGARDSDAIKSLLDSFQPPSGRDGWPADVYRAALRSARGRDGGADWPTAIVLFRRMTHLPIGAEDGGPTRAYTFKPPNGKPRDSRGRQWVPAAPLRADTATLIGLVGTAVGGGGRAPAQALNALAAHFEGSTPFSVSSGKVIDLARGRTELSAGARRAAAECVQLAKLVLDAQERSDAVGAAAQRLVEDARAVVHNYGEMARPGRESRERERRRENVPPVGQWEGGEFGEDIGEEGAWAREQGRRQGGDRGDRGGRSQDRGDRGDRGDRSDRFRDGPRNRGDRGDRFGDRGGRGDRFGERGDRGDREDRRPPRRAPRPQANPDDTWL